MFITLEGIEGAGKTSRIKGMREYLEEKGRPCIVTREPGGTKIGHKIREILLDPANAHLSFAAELLLYAADRAQHVNEIIRPAIEDGKTVICDRFIDSTLVYQGVARKLDPGLVDTINKAATGGLLPDITFLLDLPPETGLSRAWREIDTGGRDASESRFEEETLSFHRKVREGYLDLAKKEPERFAVVDASDNPENVEIAIIKRLEIFMRDAALVEMRTED
ncbi:MAG: dTMP kinase [Deltaproteobacteria bacterium]|nr:dTMP kinase [Deltaproteobacteria bacterium]